MRHCSTDYKHFEYIFTSVLNEYAPRKKKVIRGNHKPHLNKELRKAIMLRFKLKNKANKTKIDVDIAAYKKQRNYVVALNQKSKYNYLNNLDVSKGVKPFRKTCKPYFSNKHSRGDTSVILIDSIVLKFHDHPRIKMIKNKFTKIAKFSFRQVTLVDVGKAIKDIRLDKSSSGNIPAHILRRCDLCFQALTTCINQSIFSGKFPDSLKLASVSPIYEAKDTLGKTNYRPASVLPLLSKIYESLIFD